jgi:hypothetical protein
MHENNLNNNNVTTTAPTTNTTNTNTNTNQSMLAMHQNNHAAMKQGSPFLNQSKLNPNNFNSIHIGGSTNANASESSYNYYPMMSSSSNNPS